MAGTQRVKVQEDATPEEVADRIGTLNQVMGGGEQVIVDGVQDPTSEGTTKIDSRKQPMVEIRVTQDIEDMSYMSADVRGLFNFKAGNRYSVPLEVALELETQGKVWH